MGRFTAIWKVASTWYVAATLLVAVSALVGYFVFFKVYPGQPKIGVIDIPFTIISDDSASAISAFLDYARRTEDIKAVVIKLDSPGGSSSASEQLYREIVRLREKKPVVITVNTFAASGGYMMALGANYTYVKTSSLIGNVGALIVFPGTYIPGRPTEFISTSGPFKLSGGNRRHWVGLTQALKDSFIQLVLTERGERLQTSAGEVALGRIYSGIEGVHLGLVDGLGSETDAIDKAASLAGISSYGLVDINAVVSQALVESFARVFGSLRGEGDYPNLEDLRAFTSSSAALAQDAAAGKHTEGESTTLPSLRRLLLPSGLGKSQEDVLPGFPLKVNPPNLYYLYVGPSQ